MRLETVQPIQRFLAEARGHVVRNATDADVIVSEALAAKRLHQVVDLLTFLEGVDKGRRRADVHRQGAYRQ
jgi:hypothetical protein